ncbi:interactor protein for cytohesin exchange factors 1-like [Scomber scombrus]|uniref:interactor protein for cytohesin exchange factors 1-like n=1 Tax=Scomber scombrus TaxID=13677 RepID=UPI002DDAFF5A|nr:interactor protein for cytohesin exchange factors 1-like [Scomber scombrus]
MSRRRISIKDLGVVDCQGWLHRRKESRRFLGSRWKRYWFVLKKSSLYWYNDKMDVKAEGFINLSGFTIEQAKQCRKKHAITASHPLVVTIFVAAESFTEMNKWISNLSAAAEPCGLINTEECYSEGSDQDDDDSVSTSCPPDSELEPAESEDGDVLVLQSLSPADLTSENRERSPSEGTISRRRGRARKRSDSSGGERLSWLDLPGPDGEASVPQLHVKEEEKKVVDHENPADEMESLYNHLKAASLSPTGQSRRKDFRASFIQRCPNHKVNEKLHLLRILTSTLKAKELELVAVEQILTDPALTASAYRKWKLSNSILLVEISHRNQAAAGGAAELQLPEHQSG